MPAATNLFANEIESAKTNDMSGAMCWSKNDQVLLRIKIAALADEFKVFLDEEDQFYQGNEGMFVSSSIWEEYPEIHDKIYEKRDKFEETRISKVVYRYLVSAYVEKMCDLTGQHFDISHFDRIFLDDWKTSNGLDYYYDAMRVKQSAY